MPAMKLKKAPPPPPPRKRRGIPRLAAIKLVAAPSVDRALKAMQPNPARTQMLTGAFLVLGAIAAGASWAGGALVEVREAVVHQIDAAAVTAGLGFERVAITDLENKPLPPAKEAAVKAAILPEGRASLLFAEPHGVKARVETLSWVRTAKARRLWPGKVEVKVDPRTAVARWIHNGEIVVLDRLGRPTPNASPDAFAYLPLLEGPGADAVAGYVASVLERKPALAKEIAKLVRVNDRRWDVVMTSGLIVALPDGDAAHALARLERLAAEDDSLLARAGARLDLRQGERAYLAPKRELLGGPGLSDRAPTRAAAAAG